MRIQSAMASLFAMVTVACGSDGQVPGTNQRIDVGKSPRSLAIGVLSGDFLPSIFVANRDDGTISVLRQRIGMSLAFEDPVDVTVGGAPADLASGDIDADGRADIAVGNAGTPGGAIVLYQGSGAATFEEPPVTVGTAASPGAIALGTLDGDSLMDLALVTADGVVIIRHEPVGTPRGLALGSTLVTGPSAKGLAVGDVNGDSFDDVVVATSLGATVHLQNALSSGDFAPAVHLAAGTSAHAVAVGDLSGDGARDIAVADEGGDDVVLHFQAALSPGNFDTVLSLSVGKNPRDVVIADVNQDGLPDVATANFGSNDVTVYRQNPTAPGTFEPALTLEACDGPEKLAAGDLNSDGAAEIVVVCSRSDTIDVISLVP